MRKFTPYWLLFVIPVVAVTALATYSSKQQGKTDLAQQQLNFSSQFPIADYDASPPSLLDQLKQRQARGQRYDGLGYVSPHSEVTTDSSHWANGIPGLPVSMSDLVVAGLIMDSNAFLSNDKGAVYSEFKTQIEETLFTRKNEQSSLKDEITISRQGGRVRFSSGKTSLFYTGGQGMPRVSNRYVLFLKNLKGKDFEIITGYLLKDSHVVPLDHPGSGHPFTKYDGLDEASFFIQIRAAVSSNNAK